MFINKMEAVLANIMESYSVMVVAGGEALEWAAAATDVEAERLEMALWARDAARRDAHGWDGDGVAGPQWGLRRPYPADRQAKARARAKALRAARRR